MLIYIYIASLIIGGVLLGGSIFLGGKDVDASGDGHVGDAHGSDGDHALDDGGSDTSDSHGDVTGYLALFLSLRFWTFFLAFFGLTGVVVGGLGLAAPMLALALALGMGALTGVGAATVFRLLGRSEANSAVTNNDYIGRSARVLVPFGKGSTGKVRLQLKGSTVDVLATAVDEGDFKSHEEVLVVEVDGTVARVARTQALPDSSESS